MGHRRHAAAKIAGLKRVPVIVRAGAMSPDEVLAAMILENGQRRDLDPIEEARALSRLKAADKTTDDLLAERISKSQAYVSGRPGAALAHRPAAGRSAGRHAVAGPRDQGWAGSRAASPAHADPSTSSRRPTCRGTTRSPSASPSSASGSGTTRTSPAVLAASGAAPAGKPPSAPTSAPRSPDEPEAADA
ncbi:ParB/RepB/Spo0J family partition protein [Nocardioides sp. W3-2-3]|nr:ParB/RepB/Spo0J family partition protein [Nocardioides convexus]NHA02015.1 ParB/RepB/Spo0J family partition protein [Nocardioides convexus]